MSSASPTAQRLLPSFSLRKLVAFRRPAVAALELVGDGAPELDSPALFSVTKTAGNDWAEEALGIHKRCRHRLLLVALAPDALTSSLQLDLRSAAQAVSSSSLPLSPDRAAAPISAIDCSAHGDAPMQLLLSATLAAVLWHAEHASNVVLLCGAAPLHFVVAAFVALLRGKLPSGESAIEFAAALRCKLGAAGQMLRARRAEDVYIRCFARVLAHSPQLDGARIRQWKLLRCFRLEGLPLPAAAAQRRSFQIMVFAGGALVHCGACDGGVLDAAPMLRVRGDVRVEVSVVDATSFSRQECACFLFHTAFAARVVRLQQMSPSGKENYEIVVRLADVDDDGDDAFADSDGAADMLATSVGSLVTLAADQVRLLTGQ
jgi:hypothetical protein